MIANALFIAVVLLLALGFRLMSELKFFIFPTENPIRR
jgi:hypothetical protein